MRELQSIRRDLKRSLARDFRSQLESLRANAHSDVIDEAMWSEHVAVALQAIEVDWQRKRQIQAALDRILTGRYGRCDSCDAAVAEARLAAVPWATRWQERLDNARIVRGPVSMRDGFESRFDDAA